MAHPFLPLSCQQLRYRGHLKPSAHFQISKKRAFPRVSIIDNPPGDRRRLKEWIGVKAG
jgi:hypothetical protein